MKLESTIRLATVTFVLCIFIPMAWAYIGMSDYDIVDQYRNAGYPTLDCHLDATDCGSEVLMIPHNEIPTDVIELAREYLNSEYAGDTIIFPDEGPHFQLYDLTHVSDEASGFAIYFKVIYHGGSGEDGVYLYYTNGLEFVGERWIDELL
ncbi:MAG: hypothetical protein HN353_09160 [Bdellovibrionales bacterium]|jgi:hypothetical protein|nr:hypothetical protein [Bdellovibrionales bacterium]MBT3525677.1 hypothetical protein [Bdellovibrionales bacterium]MBT7669457.1 hypothetical protein [Bdellovibrionales bacterium]MBT7767857.1 hypothetical protein [Bdellovibrionales bacterium]